MKVVELAAELSGGEFGDARLNRRARVMAEAFAQYWAEKAAAASPETTTVCVGDSESDIYDLFAAAVASGQPNLHLLVRAGQNRNTTEDQDWIDQVRLAEKIGDQTVAVRARIAKTGAAKSARSRSREARTAELEIRTATIELRRPVHGDRKLPASITVNVVLCEETNPPIGIL
jgi:hypothetical protein